MSCPGCGDPDPDEKESLMIDDLVDGPEEIEDPPMKVVAASSALIKVVDDMNIAVRPDALGRAVSDLRRALRSPVRE